MLADEDATENSTPIAVIPTTVLVGTRTALEPIDIPASVSSYSANDLAFIGSGDFDDFTETEPLVSATFDFSAADPTVPYNSGGSGSYTIRGVGGNRVAIFIDGVRQPLEVDFQVGGIAINSAGRDYFDPAIFESAEIFKGTASSLYGSDALAGVVSFITPEPLDYVSPHSGETFLAYRFQYGSASENFSNVFSGAVNSGPFSVLVMYARRDYGERENMAEPIDGFLPSPNPVDAESDSFLARLDYYLNEEHKLQFTAEGFVRDTLIDVESVERSESFTGSLPIQGATSRLGTFETATTDAVSENERERYRVSIGYNFENNSTGIDKVSALLYYQSASTDDFYSEIGTDSFQDFVLPVSLSREYESNVATSYEEVTTGLSLSLEETLETSLGFHRILVGFDGIYGDSEIPYRSFGSVSVIDSQNLNDGSGNYDIGTDMFDTSRPRLPLTETLRLGAFIQDEFTFGNDLEWTLVGGLRADFYSLQSEEDEDFRNFVGVDAPDYDDFSISPGLALLRRIDDNTSVFASYRQGFRNPTPVEISGGFVHPPGADFRTAPNPDLDAETSHAFEMGVKHYSDSLRIDASVFYTFYKDYINFPTPTEEFVDEGGRNFRLYKPQNLDSVDVYGFEILAEASLGLLTENYEDWYLGTSLGRAYGTQKDENNGVEIEEPLVTVDPFQWIQYLEYRGERLRAKITGTYVDEKTRLGSSGLIPTESYYIVNLRFSLRLWETARIGFGVNNLTDQTYTRWQSVQNNIHGTRQDQLELFQRATEPGRNFFANFSVAF